MYLALEPRGRSVSALQWPARVRDTRSDAWLRLGYWRSYSGTHACMANTSPAVASPSPNLFALQRQLHYLTSCLPGMFSICSLSALCLFEPIVLFILLVSSHLLLWPESPSPPPSPNPPRPVRSSCVVGGALLKRMLQLIKECAVSK